MLWWDGSLPPLPGAALIAAHLISPFSHLTPSIPRARDATGQGGQGWRNKLHPVIEVRGSQAEEGGLGAEEQRDGCWARTLGVKSSFVNALA